MRYDRAKLEGKTCRVADSRPQTGRGAASSRSTASARATRAFLHLFIPKPTKNLGTQPHPPPPPRALLLPRPSQGDGDLVWRGFEDTSLLDLVSRSLRADGATVRRGDFEPSHRVAVYREAQPGGKLEVVDSAWKKGVTPKPLIIFQLFFHRRFRPPHALSFNPPSPPVVSQSDVIRTLAAHRPKLGPLFETRTLGDVFGPKPVVTVPSSLPTVAAFGVMYNADVSGLGVVDERGSLVAELALPDLRALKSSACFDLLLKPSLEFAQLRSGADSGGGDAATTAPLGATLGEAVSLLADAGVHRLYIVDTGCARHEGGKQNKMRNNRSDRATTLEAGSRLESLR